MIKSLPGKEPRIGKDCFIAETAAVCGNVTIGDNCSIWYGASLRGDVNSIVIGDRVNVQDCTVIHCSGGEKGKAVISSDVVIGHNATVHAAVVHEHVLIGMGSTILDGAEIGKGSIIAAHSLVLSGTKVGEYELWAGVPAEFKKKISPELVTRKIDAGVQHYIEWGKIYSEQAKDIIL